MYQITINKFEPLSDEDKKENEFRSRRGMDTSYPGFPGHENHRVVKMLEVTITDEEFAAVKKAVISVM
jgi:hypothetical protein